MTYIGFNQGQYGDLFMNLTAARVLKRLHPDERFIMSVNERYKDIAPLLSTSPDVDQVVIWRQYDGWPNCTDKALYEKLRARFGDIHLFNPMAQHTVPDWYKFWHQTEEFCVMHGLPRPDESEMNFRLPIESLEITKGEYICIAPFTSFGEQKNLSEHIINAVKRYAEEKDLKVYQLGSADDPEIEGVEKFKGNYLDAVIHMLGGKFLVAADTGMVWAASAYNFPTYSFCSTSFYPDGKLFAHNWQPKNPKQLTTFKDHMTDFSATETYRILMDNEL